MHPSTHPPIRSQVPPVYPSVRPSFYPSINPQPPDEASKRGNEQRAKHVLDKFEMQGTLAQLFLRPFHDPLFDGAARHQPKYAHRLGLTNAMDARHRLRESTTGDVFNKGTTADNRQRTSKDGDRPTTTATFIRVQASSVRHGVTPRVTNTLWRMFDAKRH